MSKGPFPRRWDKMGGGDIARDGDAVRGDTSPGEKPEPTERKDVVRFAPQTRAALDELVSEELRGPRAAVLGQAVNVLLRCLPEGVDVTFECQGGEPKIVPANGNGGGREARVDYVRVSRPPGKRVIPVTLVPE